MTAPAPVFAAGVTSWPSEGIALLILLAIVLAIATVYTNRRRDLAAPSQDAPRRELITPPQLQDDDPVSGMRDPRDI